MFRFFSKMLAVCFAFFYALTSLGQSLSPARVSFEEYYTHRHLVGPFVITSKGVQGSGSDLDGYYANVFYRKYRKDHPLPLRIADFDAQNQSEIFLFLFGMGSFLFAFIPFLAWIIFHRSKTSPFLRIFFLFLALGSVFLIMTFIPILSVGRHYENVFVAG